MAPAGILYTVPGSQAISRAILAAAAIGDIEITVPDKYEHFVDNMKPDFLAKFPHGKIPAWEGADGFGLFEGPAIARYVASLTPNTGLLGSGPKEYALIDQWMHLTETEVDTPTSLIRFMTTWPVYPYNETTHTKLLEGQTRALKTLDAHLAKNTYFVGGRLTLADLYIAAVIQRAVANTVDAPARTNFTNLIRHLNAVASHEKVKEALGPIEYIEKGITFVPPTEKANLS